MIYLDSAAVIKLCHTEQETAALVGWLGERPERPLVSSALVEVEVPRALRRNAAGALPSAPAVLDSLYRLDIDHTVRATGAAYDADDLRSVDAIHLATAQVLGGRSGEELDFVTYDRRLLKSAAHLGFTTASPGQE